jgi:hypothetical protein
VPLQHPAANAKLSLATDTLDFHLGVVMQQKSGDHWCCFGFFSKKLNSTESHYSTFDQELLAAYLSIHHFCHFCEGCQFQLWTGHKPLLTSMSQVTPPRSPCQQHQLAFTSEFNVQMLYLPGLQNVLANFLSRPTSVPGNVAAVTATVPANFRGNGRRAKPLLRNAALARRNIPSNCFFKSGQPAPSQRCVHRCFSSCGTNKVPKIHFFPFVQYLTSREAHHLQAFVFF